MNMFKPNSPDPVASSSSSSATSAPTPQETVPEPIRVTNPTDPDVVVAARAKADDVFRNRRGRDRTRLTGGGSRDTGGGGSSSVPYSRTTLG